MERSANRRLMIPHAFGELRTNGMLTEMNSRGVCANSQTPLLTKKYQVFETTKAFELRVLSLFQKQMRRKRGE